MWVNVSVTTLCVCACTCTCVVDSVQDNILVQTIQATVILLLHLFPFVSLFLIFYPVVILYYDKQNCIIPQKKTMKCKYFWLYSDEFSTWNAENSGIIILNQMYQTCKDISYLFVRGSNGRSWFLRLKIGNF